jgi:hypothetical protein
MKLLERANRRIATAASPIQQLSLCLLTPAVSPSISPRPFLLSYPCPSVFIRGPVRFFHRPPAYQFVFAKRTQPSSHLWYHIHGAVSAASNSREGKRWVLLVSKR